MKRELWLFAAWATNSIQAAIEGCRFTCEEALHDRPVCGQAKQALAGASSSILQLADFEQSLRSFQESKSKVRSKSNEGLAMENSSNLVTFHEYGRRVGMVPRSSEGRTV